MNDNSLTNEQIMGIRKMIIDTASRYLCVRYEFGSTWNDVKKYPHSLDCSELILGIFKIVGLRMPDGSQNQFNFTTSVLKPTIGDLAFFGRDCEENKIYHVGMVYSENEIIEARAFDPKASFETGKVILRPKVKWESWKNFCGYRSHPKLIA